MMEDDLKDVYEQVKKLRDLLAEKTGQRHPRSQNRI